MRRTTLLLALIVSLLFTSTGAANPPSRFTFAIDQTLLSRLSAACGFDVFLNIEGTAVATLFFDRTGTIVREIDTTPGLTFTFFAPSTGKSFSYGLGTLRTTYTNGGAVGSPAVAVGTGVHAGTGSTAPDAGRIVFNAVVLGISPEGIPIIDLVSEVSASGHFNEDIVAARCAALSAS